MSLYLYLLLAALIGAVPLTEGIARVWTGQNLRDLGQGNTGISATFRYVGTVPGLIAVLGEAGRGIGVVLLGHYCGVDPLWGLVALVSGRFLSTRGAGVTNVIWGLAWAAPWALLGIGLTGGTTWICSRNRVISRRLGALSLPLWIGYTGQAVYSAVTLGIVLVLIDYTLPDE